MKFQDGLLTALALNFVINGFIAGNLRIQYKELIKREKQVTESIINMDNIQKNFRIANMNEFNNKRNDLENERIYLLEQTDAEWNNVGKSIERSLVYGYVKDFGDYLAKWSGY